jgi:hypothetical protein
MATEINAGVVELEPDLMPLLLLSRLDPEDDAYVPLAGGARAELGRFFMPSDELGLAGPPGWLPDAAIGDALAYRVTNGELSIAHVDEDLPVAEEAVKALRSAFDQAHGTGAEHEGAVQIVDLFTTALAEHPYLFREPLPPLRQLLQAAGLQGAGKWAYERPASSEQEPGSVDDVSVAALQIVLEAYRLATSGPLEAWDELGLTPALLARMLSIRLVAPTFASRMVQMGHEPLVTDFAWALLGDHEWNAGPFLVLAMCAEFRGDTMAGEAFTDEALRADPSHRASQQHAAWYAEDRGDAARALDCLRRAGVEDDPPKVRLLAGFAVPGPASAAPQEPCPCGSARPYAHCCTHRNGHLLHERAEWLYRKAISFLLQPASQMAVCGIASARTQGDPRPLAWMRAALIDPLTQDLGLFEGGLLEEFLDLRGVLLPADELELGRSWVGIRRGLYEVVSVDAEDLRLGLRAIVSGERHEVPARAGIRYVPGMALYARIVPDGRGQRMVDAQPIAAYLHDELLELLDRDAGPIEVAAWFSTHISV